MPVLEYDPVRLSQEAADTYRRQAVARSIAANGYVAASNLGAEVAGILPASLDESIEVVAERIAGQVDFPEAASNITSNYRERVAA